MNPVLVLARNNLALTMRCAESIDTQDLDAELFVFDNGSDDGTGAWLLEEGILSTLHFKNKGVSYGWNFGLQHLFEKAEHVLCVGNDTWLPNSFYRTLLDVSESTGVPFVTGIAVDNMEQALQPAEVMPLTPNPDFSAFLIRREAWEKIGKFDETMKHYSSDQDYHIRGWRLGVPMMKAAVPYYHERSSTIRLASPEERAEIEAQANKDRARLREKWGVSPGGPDYEAMFTAATFGIDARKG